MIDKLDLFVLKMEYFNNTLLEFDTSYDLKVKTIKFDEYSILNRPAAVSQLNELETKYLSPSEMADSASKFTELATAPVADH